MVWPEIEYLDRGDSGRFPQPRIRKYQHLRTEYEVTIQPHEGGTLPLVKICKQLYNEYEDIDIHFVTKRKIRILGKLQGTINQLAAEDGLRRQYRVSIPPELCEVKAVVDIPVDEEFTEKYIYDNLKVKHFAEYGPAMENMSIGEIKRFTKPDPDNQGQRKEMDLVMVSFTGSKLPSHVSLNHIIFPIKPFVESVLPMWIPT